MPQVTIRLYGYLATIAGIRETSLSFPVLPTIKHVAEHLDIPHTEIDMILVNNNLAGFETIPHDGDRIALYPAWHHLDVSHLQEKPPTIAFVVDVNAGHLAKLLRILGFDTLYNNHYTDRELLEICQKEKRILLTRDKSLLHHQSIRWGHWIIATNPYEQIKEIVDHYDLYNKLSPLSRCLLCNEHLLPIDKKSIENHLPPRVKEWCQEFYTCPLCHRIYWKGSHYEHMMAWIKKLKK